MGLSDSLTRIMVKIHHDNGSAVYFGMLRGTGMGCTCIGFSSRQLCDLRTKSLGDMLRILCGVRNSFARLFLSRVRGIRN